MLMLECINLKELKRRGASDSVPVMIATDSHGEDRLRRGVGKVFAVNAKRARSHRQHNLFWAAARRVFDNQEQFASVESLVDATMIEIGFCEGRQQFNGEAFWVPKSLSFASLGQDAFQTDVFDPSIRVWSEHFGIALEDLLNGF